MNLHLKYVCVVLSFIFMATNSLHADVLSAAPGGFQIKITTTTKAAPAEVYSALTSDFGKWWDPVHSYSGKSENLSMDLDQRCILERLPEGGFVRHLEIVYHEPGKKLRLTGGLGPLQELGIHGALTFELEEKDEQTEIVLSYNVVGFKGMQLDKVAAVVDRVLEDQVARLQKHCDSN